MAAFPTRTELMKTIRKLLPPLALVGALALVPVTASSFAAADTTNYQELEKFMSVYERVKANYVDKVDDHTLIKGAIDGMLSALDPHSSYAEASDFDQLKTTTDGNYGGLGLTVSIEDGAVKVVAPTEDTPAWRAGIKSGDYITHINGELVYGLNLDEAVAKMRGDPGTPIKLTIVRPGRDKPFDVAMNRERIELRPVKWEIKDGIGFGDRRRSAAGSSAGPDHGRAELRQGLGPDRRPDRTGQRPAPHHGALLHAVGALGSGRRDRSRHRRAAAFGRGL